MRAAGFAFAVMFLAGCTGEEPLAPVAAPVPLLDVPPPGPPTAANWSADNIRDLHPLAPTRAAKVSRPISSLPAYDVTLTTLAPVIEGFAADPDNPWAVAHGVLARGAEFRLSDGRPAIAHLFASYSEPRTIGTLTLIGFPRVRGDIRVEPHTDLILKNVAEAGLSPDTLFSAGGGSVTVADLYRYTLLKTFLVPASNKSSYDAPNDMPWGVQALAAWAPPGPLMWTAADGTRMDMDELTHFLVAVMHQESKFMFDAMRAGASFERSGQSLFSYTCGGAHLVQGATYAVARGYGHPEDRKAVELQVPLLFYRLPIELRIYDAALAKNKKFQVTLLVQRMKFLGHFLETMSKLQALGFYTADDAQAATLEGAAQNLALTVSALQKANVFDHLPELRKADEQAYLDVVGDAAHAVRGLELALGRGTISY